MLKRTLAVLLVGVLIQLAFVQSASASSKEDKEVRLAQKVKAGVLKLGKGSGARVRVKLKDKTRLVGYISEVKDDSFVLVNSKSGASTDVAYTNVAALQGHSLPTGVSVAIGIGIGVGLFFLITLILQATGHLP